MKNLGNVRLPIPQSKINSKYPYLNEQSITAWFPKWVYNMIENYAHIQELFSKKDISLSALPRPQNKPVIITGSGPSLDDSITYLSKWVHTIMTGATCASVYPKHNIKPDFISAFDSHETIVDYISDFEWEGTSLLTHPMSNPKLFKFWKWNIYLFRRIMQEIELFELTLPLVYPKLPVGIVMTTNVVNNLITISKFLGFKAIFLFGVDLAYTKDKGRCCYYDKDFKPNPLTMDDFDDTKRSWMYYYDNTKLITTQDFIFQKRQLYDLWKQVDIPMFNCSKHSILTEMPYIDPQEVVEKQGRGFEKLYEGFDKNKAIGSFVNKLNQRKLLTGRVFK